MVEFEVRLSGLGMRCPAKAGSRVRTANKLFAVAVISCFTLACSGSVDGNVVSMGGPLGDLTMEFTSCASGEHMQFHGAFLDLDDPFSGGIRLEQTA